jgi:MFS family permease
MQKEPPLSGDAASRATPAYGWVIVATCAIMIFITYGLNYSYSVFFKPLAELFKGDRATISLIFSLSMIIRGAAAIGTGWLADKYGARKIMVGCGLMMGAGYLLSSRADALWQFFLTYAVVEAIGMSGIFGIGTALVTRWFSRNRGLALGIMVSGSGLGTFLIVPGVEHLINVMKLSPTFFIIGIAAGSLMIIGALLLRPPPPPKLTPANETTPAGASLCEAVRDVRLYLVMVCFLLFFIGTQIVMVHLINYATDNGIDPLVAATFVGVIGLASIASRLSMGVITEKIGLYWGFLLIGVSLTLSFVLLLFTRSVWSFYVFTLLFSIPYGGEVTQIPLVIGRYFGTRSMSTLVGMTVFAIGVGGALGPWLAGKIYDLTSSYNAAFITGAVIAAVSMGVVLLLKQQDTGQVKSSVWFGGGDKRTTSGTF